VGRPGAGARGPRRWWPDPGEGGPIRVGGRQCLLASGSGMVAPVICVGGAARICAPALLRDARPPDGGLCCGALWVGAEPVYPGTKVGSRGIGAMENAVAAGGSRLSGRCPALAGVRGQGFESPLAPLVRHTFATSGAGLQHKVQRQRPGLKISATAFQVGLAPLGRLRPSAHESAGFSGRSRPLTT